MDPVYFFAPYGVSLLGLCLLERFFHALLSLFLPGSSSKSLRAQLVVGSALNLVSSLFSAVAGVFLRCVYVLGWSFAFFLVVYVIFSVFYSLYEEHPRVFLYMFDFYSARVGPLLHGFVLLPLQLLNLVMKGLLPFYNGSVWMAKTLISKGVFPLLWDNVSFLVEFCVYVMDVFRGLCESLVSFVFGLGCSNFSCLRVSPALDLVSPMSSVRGAALVATKFAQRVCLPVALPVEFLLYPLTDVGLAKALHGLANGLLEVFLHIPHATLKRCRAFRAGAGPSGLLMCTPDIRPATDLFVSGLRSAGEVLDNWAGVFLAMAKQQLGGGAAPTGPSCGSGGVYLSPAALRGSALEGAQVTLGLSEWLVASANGTHALFYGRVTTGVTVREWPVPVDVGMGLAAVGYDEAAEVEVSTATLGQRPSARQTASLLGCRCDDSGGGLVVTCSMVGVAGEASNATHAFAVGFQDSTWSSQMPCSAVEISVRSVRWPVRRYEGKTVPFAGAILDLPGGDCASRGSCESVDATIWLVPRCDALRPEQCSVDAVGTSCFPFCMAARLHGRRNAPPVFVNAETWRGGRQLLGRDCVLRQPGAVSAGSVRVGGGVLTSAVYSAGPYGVADSGGAPAFASGSGDGSGCLSGPSVVSWAAANLSRPDPRSVPAHLRRTGQPFAIAGDTILLEFPAADGSSTVEVDRLTGNQRDVYGLVPGWAGLPAAPRTLVPLGELRSSERARVVVPLDYVGARVRSTGSRNYVFYAVSPELRIFQVYLDYCRDPSRLPQMQAMVLSSYSALRVYRVRAYCQELCEVGELSAQFSFDGFSNGSFSAGSFPQDCGRVYNASIDGLEYVDEQNLAVTVQVADRSYDPLARAGSNSTYVTYWLNPQTMQARREEMWPSAVPSTLSSGACAFGDGVPHVGSMATEVVVAGVHVLHRVLEVFLSAPGLVAFWSGGSPCATDGRGHSVVESCASDLFSLDDFFDSVDSATAMFWGVPVWVVEQMEQGKAVEYSLVSDVMRGFSAYGRGTVDVTQLRGGVMSLLNTPLADQFSSLYALVRQPGAMSGASKVVGAASSWARYTARFFSEAGSGLAERIVAGRGLDLAEVWRLCVGVLYDSKPVFRSAVTERASSACLGLQVMVGGANPLGRVLHHSCRSSALLLDGAMEAFLRLFVDAPVLKCVCKDSEGRLVSKYAREHCLWRAPLTMQPDLLRMIAAAEGSVAGDAYLCPAVVGYARDRMDAALRPYFASVFQSLDGLGDLVDYLLVGYDSDAGQCDDFNKNPQVVVIMPEPVDYFQGCGATTYCRSRCAGDWGAFERALSAYDASSLTNAVTRAHKVDSMFFPSVVSDIVPPGKILAMTTPDACGAWVCRDESDDCLAVGVVRESSLLRVHYYCVPPRPSASVYGTDKPGVNWEGSFAAGSVRQVAFLSADGTSAALIVDKDVWLVQKSGASRVVLKTESVLSLSSLQMYPMYVTDFLAVRDRLLVNVAVRYVRGDEFDRDVATLWVHPQSVVDVANNPADRFPAVVQPSMKQLWKGYACSEYDARGEAGKVSLLMWPTTKAGSVRRLSLSWTERSVTVLAIEPFELAQSLVARATFFPRDVVLSKRLRELRDLREIRAFATGGAEYDWLRQLRLSGLDLSFSSVYLANSQPVAATVAVRTSCDGLDCRGCSDPTLRSLCFAYQSCAVFRCIGTPVNLKRPLCGVGGTLKSLGNVGVESVHGAWVMFVDIYMILLQLGTVRNLPGVEVSFPDDSFMSNICAAKDVSAELISVLTSTVNSALQRAQSLTGVFASAGALDSSVHTLMSMSTAAVTGFLHQICLAPVYLLSVGHKVMMCQVSGMLGVVGQGGFRVNIQPARFSSTDAISGQCLTKSAEVSAMQTGDASEMRGSASQAANLLAYSGSVGVMKRLEPFMHAADGLLTYFVGVVGKFADVMQTLDADHCVLPDVTLNSSARCACGDRPVGVAQARRLEGLGDYAYWCSGTLAMPDAENRLQIVWNPFSYAELQAIVGPRLDEYLAAASLSAAAPVPNHETFAAQGVSVISVLTRCRQNYVSKQWDPAAYVRYDAAMLEREVKGGVPVQAGDPSDSVGRCLVDSAQSGVGNGACLDAFMLSKRYNEDYWGYVAVDPGVSSVLLDACVVFSGPASNKSVSRERRAKFQGCLAGYEDQSECDLSAFVWSAASSNAVPVASRHTVHAEGFSQVDDSVEYRFNLARDLVMNELAGLMDFTNSELEAAVFSAEGDAIHQLLDCVFLGPYARMDYWPVPLCDEQSEPDCLVGPYWSRDAGGGKSRSLDVDGCDTTQELPFTCGSPTRKAMVKDFVRQYLETGEKNANWVEELVRAWLRDVSAAWWDPSAFSCNASDCGRGHLPLNLSRVSLQISSERLVAALNDRARAFFGAAMRTSEPWVNFLSAEEVRKYNWTTSPGSHRVSPAAAYHPASPSMKYDASEAASPPTTVGGYSLWHSCHAALRQVMFTMPLGDDGSLRGGMPEFKGGGLAEISEYVKRLVRDSYQDSPLYWHYQPRHHPSRSKMCAGSASGDARLSRGSVSFSDYSVNGQMIFNGSEVPPVSVLGFYSGELGSGQAGFAPGLNEHLGFLDRASSERWVLGGTVLTTTGENLMRFGPGGLKLGNVPMTVQRALGFDSNFSGDLDAVLRSGLKESDRQHTVARAVLHGCEAHADTPESLLEDYAESLFPMAQGVRESGVGSYCLRFAVELAKLSALELIQGVSLDVLVAQKEQVSAWRKRCGTQVQLVGMCSALDMYRDGGFQPYACLHPWRYSANFSVEFYVTPDCLVRLGDYFYDPCVCRPEWCAQTNGTIDVDFSLLEGSACRLKFDPRDVVQSVEMGWWAQDDPDPRAAAWNDYLGDPVNFLNFGALVSGLLADPLSVGNAPVGSHWAYAEGFMNETGAFCDMVSDYWPETFEYPVGYHVTVPCEASEAGYRTFDNVFALDLDAQGQPWMRYVEDQTRDADLLDSHFGAGGICRGTNFGFDMYETNTMRVCTRVTDGEDVDVHVPRGQIFKTELGEPRCSSSSRELPWGDQSFYDYLDSSFSSVGTVPNLPPASARFYPETNDLLMVPGPQHLMNVEGWGGACQDFAIPNCSAGDRWRCPPGFVCTGSGVCQHPSVQCVRHSDCPGEMMCTGLGTCRVPMVSVENQQGNDTSFRAHTADCAGESFSMLGGSYWGYVPDLLEAHGMCSYRHWQEYLYTMQMCNCTPGNSASCTLDARTCPYYLFSNQLVNNKWWNSSDSAPSRLKMIPTTCDRDYERFSMGGRELKSCVPTPSQMFLMGQDGTYQQTADRDVFWRIYNNEQRTVGLRMMPFRSDSRQGYLSGNSFDRIKSCMSIQQCFVDDFTKNGRVSMLTDGVRRANRTTILGVPYAADDQFKCGVMGYYDSAKQKCVVDEKLFPLYHVFCNPSRKSVLDTCSKSLVQGSMQARCDAVQSEYSAQYSVIQDVNVPGLNAFFSVFKAVQTLSDHLSMVECVAAIYNVISSPPFESRGLYYVFAFTLYEVPFSWFYQCNVGSSIQVANNFDKKLYACTFYENRNEISAYSTPLDMRYTDFPSYIYNVRGGYVRSAFEAERSRQLQLALSAWREAVESVRARLFGAKAGVDLTYPMCYSELRWDIPASNALKRVLIESFVRNRCSGSLIQNYVSMYNERYKTNYGTRTILQALTTMGGNLTAQGSVVSSRKILTGLIASFGSSKLTSGVSVDSISLAATPLALDLSMPDVGSAAYQDVQGAWKQLAGVLPNTQDVSVGENSQDCQFSELLNVYSGADGKVLVNEDTDLVSGFGTAVQTCPVYARGQFNCSYPSYVLSGVSYALQGNLGGVEVQFERYVKGLYSEVKRLYDLKITELVNAGAIRPIQMSPLPFFTEEPGLSFGNFQFNLQSVSNYMSNINPDVRTPVMCAAGNQQVDYNKCTDPNFLSLKQHVYSEYAKNGGVVVPDRSQLNWRVSRAMMGSGGIFSFASVNRDISKQYMKKLFDDPTVCSMSAANRQDRLCYFSSTGSLTNRTTITPWLSGMWNPYDQCDVEQMDTQSGNTEIIDSYCYYEQVCPASKGPNTLTVDFYKNMPNNQVCIQRNSEKTKNLNVNPKLLYNLCRHELEEESICKHVQGMLGGSDGFPAEQYNVNGNLFTLHDFGKVPAGDGQLFGNVLLHGKKSDYGFLRFSNSHIGGQHVGLRISGDSLRVSRMPLKDVMDKSHMSSWDTLDVAQWVSGWLAAVQGDHLAYESGLRNADYVVGQDSRGQPRFSWDCPLRRRAFYTGGVSNLRPHLPSARRSRAIFGGVNGNLFAHPTQSRQESSDHFGRYKTTNGFCFCPMTEESWPDMCGIPVDASYSHNCSLLSTVRAIQGQAWGWSHAFKPRNMQYEEKVCSVQVDWPFVEGTLRDGSKVTRDDVDQSIWSGSTDVEGRRCHVLDRVPDFAYSYVSRNELRKSGFTTLARGVCHTGRAQRIALYNERCARVSKGADASRLLCTDNKKIAVERPASLRPAFSARRTRFFRRSCRSCTAPPRFSSRGGVPIAPESSFGLPYRVSVERALAKSLRAVLCEDPAKCGGIFNGSSWRKGVFLEVLLRNPRALFAGGVVSASQLRSNVSDAFTSGRFSTDPPQDGALWERPWVYCPDKESLRTGSGCNGSISKARWRSDKVGSCYATVVDAMKGGVDPFAKTDICNIDPRLTRLCQKIREAQSLVSSANCIRSGAPECATREYVYSPATWETTNRAFVHQTVRDYYMRVDGCTGDSDCICGVQPDLSALRTRNNQFLRGCSAVPVMTLRSVLVDLKLLIFPMCKMASTVLSIAFNLVLMLSSSTRELATANIVLEWAQFKQESAVVTEKVSDLFFDMIFGTGVMGPWMQRGVVTACKTINYAYNYTANVWCGLVVRKLPLFLSTLRAIGGWIDVGFTVANDIFSVILNNYLPEAMLDLYQYGYVEFFQSARYREKQKSYEKRVKAGLVNPDQPSVLDDDMKKAERRPDNRIMESTSRGRMSRLEKKMFRSGAGVLSVLPYVGDAVEVGLALYDLQDQITTAIKIKEALEQFPKSFTLFDFDNFYSVIDNLVNFLNTDFLCFDIDKDVEPLQCDALQTASPSQSDVDTMAPRPSSCWAEAQQRDVAVSNLYSCTPTSTCCDNVFGCDDPSRARLCSACPAVSADSGMIKFGCNTMVQRCQCGLQSVVVDKCSAQRDCGPSASCSLLASLDDVSFGALSSCSQCSTSPVCLMGSSKLYGECTCLTDADVKVELCSEPPGSRVNPNPSKLCGFARDQGSFYSWAELSLVRCIYAVGARCADVVTESGNSIKIPVCTRVKQSQVAYSSRRLLSVEPELTRVQLPSVFLPNDPADDVTAEVVHRVVTESAWNHTSTPCSTLAHAYVSGHALGPVDEATLHSCVYWRTVARQLIKENSLDSLKHIDTFLLSSGDFASSLGQQGVLRELLSKPLVLLYAALYSQWFKPVRAALLASHEPETGLFIGNLTRRTWKLGSDAWKRWKSRLDAKGRGLRENASVRRAVNGSRGRRLMGVWDDAQSGVRVVPFYSMASTMVGELNFTKGPSKSNGESWGSDTFSVVGVDYGADCPAADLLVSNLKYVTLVSRKYYSHMPQMHFAPRSNRTRFSDLVPTLKFSRQSTENAGVAGNLVFYYFKVLTGLSVADLADFFSRPCPKDDCFAANRWTASYFVESLLFCRLEDVMYCNPDRYGLTASFLWVMACCLLISLLLSYMGLGFLVYLLVALIPLLSIWVSSGVSIRCFPMLPACMLDDVVDSVKFIFPLKASVPQSMRVNGSQALKPCSDFGYTAWQDPLTAVLCDLGFCDGLENKWIFSVSYWKFGDMHAGLQGSSSDAYRFCTFLTMGWVVPAVFLGTVGLTVASLLCFTVIGLLSVVVDIVWKTIMFNHLDG